jgi:hypothetical protein
MTDPRILNKAISEGQSAMYARQLEETIRAVKIELVVARQGLADVARVLCPDQVDLLAGKHPGSSAATLPLQELITTMKGVAQTLRLIAANSTKSPGSQEDKLLVRVMELEGLLRAEKRRADLFERSKANAEQKLEAERNRAEKAARGRGQQGRGERGVDRESEPEPRNGSKEGPRQPPIARADLRPVNEIEEWETWQADFELEEPQETRTHIMQIVGFVGKSSRASIAEIAAGTGQDLHKAGKTTKYASVNCHLLSEQGTDLKSGVGDPPERIYSLSPKGDWYFKRLNVQTPEKSRTESQISLVNPRMQGGLKTRVGARFEQLGWQVDYAPKPIKFEDDTIPAPNLVIAKESVTLNVEVETGEHLRNESAEYWDIKFTDACRVSQGVLCIVTEGRSQMTTLLGKINFWMAKKKMDEIFIYATTLTHLREVQPDEIPWEKAERKVGPL